MARAAMAVRIRTINDSKCVGVIVKDDMTIADLIAKGIYISI
jgi:hypothetical protein